MTYRQGNHQPQNIYRDDTYIGVMFSADDAQNVVEALNDRDDQGPCTEGECAACNTLDREVTPVQKGHAANVDCAGCSDCASIAWMKPQEAEDHPPKAATS